ncbi:hypothetical protein SAMN05192574_105288 [Mucilaginibacter gossypiicola]|uniref:Uncharacterized protein n=1 Tax=Mucilaginibacter gossypiicola TaxID=551995 RepID=A0A1H8LX53_9SPHI|nr:hypothetical protein [Mucilaginibacter gossypiicola]SEO09675.1 hypothetical protein SAMN05192574_105288 [Mucilaginibacter gossypiicola]
MQPIYINRDKNEYKFFKKNFIEICNEFRSQNRALAFAFILYDFKSPQVKKVLEDRDYWNALNAISGKHLTVFTFHYKERPRFKPHNILTTLISMPIFGPPENEIDDIMIKYFDNRQKISYPAILFFQVDQIKVIDTMLIGLNNEQIEESFLEIKKYLDRGVSALSKIDPQNRDNHKEVFDCLEMEIKNFQSIKLIQRMTRRAGNILGLVSSIKGLF